jgi:predicted permease
MHTILQDLRYTLRTMRRSPGFTAVAILTLALGIGANTTIFSWMQGFVARPLPLVRAPERLVALETRAPGGVGWSVSYPNYADWREQARTVDGIIATSMMQFSLRAAGEGGGEGTAQSAWGLFVSANYFDVLGIRPLLGRGFLPAEDSVPRGAPVTVLSYGLWQRQFGGDPGIVGKEVLVNNQPFTVVGVAPRSFGGTWVGLNFDLYVPVMMQPALSPGAGLIERRGTYWLQGYARLKPGATVAQARTELNAIQERIGEVHAAARGTGVIVTPFDRQGAQEWLRPVFIALLAVTGLVLLIACANIANLLLARAAGRRREVGIRLALGASRGRLISQLLTESLFLATLGGGAGVLLSVWARPWLGALIPTTQYPVDAALYSGSLDARVLSFTAAATVLAALAFGLAPALRASRPELVPALKDGGGDRGVARTRLGGGLVVAQVALTLVALVSSGLFLRTMHAMREADVGFRDPEQVLLVSTNLHLAGHKRATGEPFMDRLLERARALPGVSAAGLAMSVPLGFGGGSGSTVKIEGYTPQRDENMSVSYNSVSPDYFRTMGITLVRGREFGDDDRAGSLPVAIVNESFAERYWPGEDPIGKRFDPTTGQWLTVVGVAKDGKYEQLDDPPQPFMYFPLAQWYSADITLHLRATGDPNALVSTVRKSFEALDPGLPFLQPRTLEEHMGAAMLAQRLGALLLSVLGAIALALAVIGLYGVISYGVSQRTRELGIRVALGAGRGEVLRLIIREGMGLAALGVAIGIVGAFAGGRLLASQLYGVSPADPLTYAAIALLLAGVALVASYIPARRAARIDPMLALRGE